MGASICLRNLGLVCLEKKHIVLLVCIDQPSRFMVESGLLLCRQILARHGTRRLKWCPVACLSMQSRVQTRQSQRDGHHRVKILYSLMCRALRIDLHPRGQNWLRELWFRLGWPNVRRLTPRLGCNRQDDPHRLGCNLSDRWLKRIPGQSYGCSYDCQSF